MPDENAPVDGEDAKNYPRWVGFDVSREEVTVVDMSVPDEGPLVVEYDSTWPLQQGSRSKAYQVMYARVANYLNDHGIETVVVRASAVSGHSATMGLLEGAELRGVVVTASASKVDNVIVSAKSAASKSSSRGKVDKYVNDNPYWSENTTGKLRKGSRAVAYLVIAESRKLSTDD